jgi:hypothetical protein
MIVVLGMLPSLSLLGEKNVIIIVRMYSTILMYGIHNCDLSFCNEKTNFVHDVRIFIMSFTDTFSGRDFLA